MHILIDLRRYHINATYLVKYLLRLRSKVTVVSRNFESQEDYSLLTPIHISRYKLDQSNTIILSRLLDHHTSSLVTDKTNSILYYVQTKVNGDRPDRWLRVLLKLIIFRIRHLFYCPPIHVISPCRSSDPNLISKSICSLLKPITFVHPIIIDNQSNSTPSLSPTTTFSICMIGKLWSSRKNHLWLSNWLSKFNTDLTIELNYIGESLECSSNTTSKDQAYYHKLMHRLSLMKADYRINIYRDCSHDECLSILSSSHLFVLPSSRESFSISVLESLALEIPVLISTMNGASSYIQPGINGELFLEDSFSSFDKQLSSMISNYECYTASTINYLPNTTSLSSLLGFI